MKAFYEDLELEVDSGVYPPREDTFLLAENIEAEKGEKVLEIGAGCGMLSILCSKKGADVVSVDINPKAVECSRKNAERYDLDIEFKKSNLFEKIDEKFDLIIFNPPYLPGKREFKEDESLVDSGEIKKFLKEYKNYLKPEGRALLITSSLTEEKVEGEIIAEKKLDFEKLFLYKLEE
ncbi:MAG: HemK2/MTQ2 family protein methyltransferase [Candidatus Undinarchaeales archaeon]